MEILSECRKQFGQDLCISWENLSGFRKRSCRDFEGISVKKEEHLINVSNEILPGLRQEYCRDFARFFLGISKRILWKAIGEILKKKIIETKSRSWWKFCQFLLKFCQHFGLKPCWNLKQKFNGILKFLDTGWANSTLRAKLFGEIPNSAQSLMYPKQ